MHFLHSTPPDSAPQPAPRSSKHSAATNSTKSQCSIVPISAIKDPQYPKLRPSPRYWQEKDRLFRLLHPRSNHVLANISNIDHQKVTTGRYDAPSLPLPLMALIAPPLRRTQNARQEYDSASPKDHPPCSFPPRIRTTHITSLAPRNLA